MSVHDERFRHGNDLAGRFAPRPRIRTPARQTPGDDATTRLRCRGAGIRGVPPPGATFQVEWAAGVPEERLAQAWTGVTNAVAGVFCSSLSTLAPSTMHYRPAMAEPWSAIDPPTSAQDVVRGLAANASSADRGRGVVVYGALSQEAVCTENLTGFRKLLPCRDQAGIGGLLGPAAVLTSSFHTLELRGHMDANGVPSDAPCGMQACVACRTADRANDLSRIWSSRSCTSTCRLMAD